MTNWDNLHALSKDELAWFLMAYSDNCRCCVYKKQGDLSQRGCGREDVDDTCVGGYRKWLDREPDQDDEFMFRVCKNNVLIDRWNAMSYAFQDGWKLKYENGLAVDIVEDCDTGEQLTKPF